MDLKKVSNVEVSDINMNDYPDFADAHISYAEYNGKEMNEQELEELNTHSDFLYEQIEFKIQ